MRWSAILLSLIMPGLGHTALGRPVAGSAISAAFWAGALVSVWRGVTRDQPVLDEVFAVAAVGVVLVYVVCQVTLLFAVARAALSRDAPAREMHFRLGLAAATRDESETAERELRRVLALDPTDVEAHLNLGALYARQDRAPLARRHLKRCRRFDAEGKWDWEVDRQLRLLREAQAQTTEKG